MPRLDEESRIHVWILNILITAKISLKEEGALDNTKTPSTNLLPIKIFYLDV
tara:strand:+ start:1008 stop:1163 length:156 start_codon:yes stop_codon:yes gene_type:complete